MSSLPSVREAPPLGAGPGAQAPGAGALWVVLGGEPPPGSASTSETGGGAWTDSLLVAGRLLVFVTVAAVLLALALGSLAALLGATGGGDPRRREPVPAGPWREGGQDARGALPPDRFTLRLGEGFRFEDGQVVARSQEGPDVVFRYLPPQVGGMALRYNPLSQQVESGLEPTLTSPVPLLVAAHARTFERPPDLGRLTTGDLAGWPENAPVGPKARFVLLQSRAGDAYLLTLTELEAAVGRYDEWRIGFAYERVRLPLGAAGGPASPPLSGRLVFRDWYRTKMIVRVDLATGKEETLADGILPSTVGDRLLGYGDTSGAYVVQDGAGRTLHTIRFDERVLGPELSPDGTRIAATVDRPGPPTVVGGTTIPGLPTPSVAVFDLEGKERAAVVGYDDATWAPDGRLIATGPRNDPGLFEIDPTTGRVVPLSARIGAPLTPCVSPDGRTIAFVTGDRVWWIDRDGSNLRQVFPHGLTQLHPSFSPDGTKVALVVCNQLGISGTGEVYVVDLATGRPSPIRTSAGLSLVPDPSTRLSWIR